MIFKKKKELRNVHILAGELKEGDQFVYWAVMKDGLYPQPSMIMGISKLHPRGKKLIIKVKDGREMELHPETLVVIQEPR